MSSIDYYDNYVLFLKANGVTSPQGDRQPLSFGIFYECLSCSSTRISKTFLTECPFCSSKSLRVWYLFPNNSFDSYYDLKPKNNDLEVAYEN